MSFSLPLIGSSKDSLKVSIFTRLIMTIYEAGREWLFVQYLLYRLLLLQLIALQNGKMSHDNRDTFGSSLLRFYWLTLLHFSSTLHRVHLNFFELLLQLFFRFISVPPHILSSAHFYPIQEVVSIPVKNRGVFWFKFFSCDTCLSFQSICPWNLLKVMRKFQVDCSH